MKSTIKIISLIALIKLLLLLSITYAQDKRQSNYTFSIDNFQLVNLNKPSSRRAKRGATPTSPCLPKVEEYAKQSEYKPKEKYSLKRINRILDSDQLTKFAIINFSKNPGTVREISYDRFKLNDAHQSFFTNDYCSDVDTSDLIEFKLLDDGIYVKLDYGSESFTDIERFVDEENNLKVPMSILLEFKNDSNWNLRFAFNFDLTVKSVSTSKVTEAIFETPQESNEALYKGFDDIYDQIEAELLLCNIQEELFTSQAKIESVRKLIDLKDSLKDYENLGRNIRKRDYRNNYPDTRIFSEKLLEVIKLLAGPEFNFHKKLREKVREEGNFAIKRILKNDRTLNMKRNEYNNFLSKLAVLYHYSTYSYFPYISSEDNTREKYYNNRNKYYDRMIKKNQNIVKYSKALFGYDSPKDYHTKRAISDKFTVVDLVESITYVVSKELKKLLRTHFLLAEIDIKNHDTKQKLTPEQILTNREDKTREFLGTDGEISKKELLIDQTRNDKELTGFGAGIPIAGPIWAAVHSIDKQKIVDNYESELDDLLNTFRRATLAIEASYTTSFTNLYKKAILNQLISLKESFFKKYNIDTKTKFEDIPYVTKKSTNYSSKNFKRFVINFRNYLKKNTEVEENNEGSIKDLVEKKSYYLPDLSKMLQNARTKVIDELEILSSEQIKTRRMSSDIEQDNDKLIARTATDTLVTLLGYVPGATGVLIDVFGQWGSSVFFDYLNDWDGTNHMKKEFIPNLTAVLNNQERKIKLDNVNYQARLNSVIRVQELLVSFYEQTLTVINIIPKPVSRINEDMITQHEGEDKTPGPKIDNVPSSIVYIPEIIKSVNKDEFISLKYNTEYRFMYFNNSLSDGAPLYVTDDFENVNPDFSHLYSTYYAKEGHLYLASYSPSRRRNREQVGYIVYPKKYIKFKLHPAGVLPQNSPKDRKVRNNDAVWIQALDGTSTISELFKSGKSIPDRVALNSNRYLTLTAGMHGRPGQTFFIKKGIRLSTEINNKKVFYEGINLSDMRSLLGLIEYKGYENDYYQIGAKK